MDNKTKLDFLIYGPPKTGSSSLMTYLLLGGKISTHKEKTEPFFFTNSNISDIDIYNYNRCFNDDNTLKCEKSTGYFHTPLALENIKKFCKEDIKFITILRNPVELVLSYYKHFKSLGYILKDKKHIDMIKQKSIDELWNFDSNPTEEEKAIFINMPSIDDICFNSSEYYWIKDMGLYNEHLTRLLNTIDKRYVKIYEYENWKKSNLEVIEDIHNFLDLKFERTLYKEEIFENSSVEWVNNLKYCGIELDPSRDIQEKHIDFLKEFYAESNEEIRTKFNIGTKW